MALRLALLSALLLAAPLAGCVGSKDEPGTPTPSTPTPTTPTEPTPEAPPPLAVHAPWWEVGEWWDVELTRTGRGSGTFRLVHMWNDSDTSHFWLGVREREAAIEHALFDTNPFLGRIHHDVLAPHERGMHATMYDFPLADGKRWGGILLAGDWELEARADPAREGAFLVSGRGADGSTIAYDYDPTTRWFRSIEIKNAQNETTLTAVVKDHGTGEKGTFWFERGRDYYLGPLQKEPRGVHSEEIPVEDEGLDFLLLHLDLQTTGPVELQLLDPGGNVAHRETVTSPAGGALQRLVELPKPAQGTWQLRFIMVAGALEGSIRGVGVFETERTV